MHIKKIYCILFLLLIGIIFAYPIDAQAESTGTEPAKEEDAWVPDPVSSVKFESITNAEIAGFAIDSLGYPWAWGFNGNGRTGVGRTTGYLGGMTKMPFFDTNDIKVKEISSSYRTSFALTDDGKVYSWGDGGYGAPGTGGISDQATPSLVEFSEKILMVDATDELSAATVYAVGESGKIYAWGYTGRYLIPGKIPATVYKPMEIPELSAISQSENGVTQIKAGYNHVLMLTKDGNVYSWGQGSFGSAGHGATDNSSSVPKRITFFDKGEVTAIDARYHHSMIQTNDGSLYEFGYLYGKSKTGGVQTVSTPQLVEIDRSSAYYTPEIKSFNAGRYNGSFIDQHGRVWIWGDNNFYQFMTEGPLTGTEGAGKPYDFRNPDKGKLNKYLSKATQIPKTMGDGDTQGNNTDIKAPVFSNVPISQYSLYNTYGYKYQGAWGVIDGGYPRKHPTIYDKKYYKTTGTKKSFVHRPGTYVYSYDRDKAHEQVYFVDKEGRKLVYAVIQDSATTLSGNFYVAADDYTGGWYYEDKKTSILPKGVTRETSVPEVLPAEKGWIELSIGGQPNDFTGNQLVELPYIHQMDVYESATTMIDPAGNLYRQALNGSGNIAWGWDYDPIYDSNSNVKPEEDGLYDSYVYEVMFMRGAPRQIPGSIDIKSKKEKRYLSDKTSENVEMKIDIGTAYHDTQLNIKVEPELKQLKMISMPYDEHSDEFSILSPTYEEFMDAYNNSKTKGFTTSDIALSNGWEGIKHEVGQPPIETLVDKSIKVSDNSVIWIMLQTQGYSNYVTTTKRIVYDNFYTDQEVRTAGALLKDENQQLYEPRTDNISKVTKDKYPEKVGFPLDKNKNVIKNPTFGYDKVSVKRISDEVLDELPLKPKFSHHYNWAENQAEEKKYVLDNSDVQNNGPGDIGETTGKMPYNGTDQLLHKFYYTENPDIYYNLHYVAVDKDGKKLPVEEFALPSELHILKEIEMVRTVPELNINKKMLPNKYFMEHSAPKDTIDVAHFEKLSENRTIQFTIPFDKTIKDVTLYYLYDKTEKDVTLNIRQVIQGESKVEVPKTGYVSYQKTDDKWNKQPGVNQVKVPSGLENTDVLYKTIKTKVNNDSSRFVLKDIVPQYYEYSGFKQSSTKESNQSAQLQTEKDIKIDYSDDSTEKWVTVYLKPTTKSPLNYSWETISNKFGNLFVQIRLKFYSKVKEEKKEYVNLDLKADDVLSSYYHNLDDYYMRFEIPGVYQSKKYKSNDVTEDVILDASKVEIAKLPNVIPMNYYYTDSNGNEVESRVKNGDYNGIVNPEVSIGHAGFSDFRAVLDKDEIDTTDSNEIVLWYHVQYTVNLVFPP